MIFWRGWRVGWQNRSSESEHEIEDSMQAAPAHLQRMMVLMDVHALTVPGGN